jgi:hypothetical protein
MKSLVTKIVSLETIAEVKIYVHSQKLLFLVDPNSVNQHPDYCYSNRSDQIQHEIPPRIVDPVDRIVEESDQYPNHEVEGRNPRVRPQEWPSISVHARPRDLKKGPNSAIVDHHRPEQGETNDAQSKETSFELLRFIHVAVRGRSHCCATRKPTGCRCT